MTSGLYKPGRAAGTCIPVSAASRLADVWSVLECPAQSDLSKELKRRRRTEDYD